MRKMPKRKLAAIARALAAEWAMTMSEAMETAAIFFGEVPNGDPA